MPRSHGIDGYVVTLAVVIGRDTESLRQCAAAVS
jgi:hypothetical protein